MQHEQQAATGKPASFYQPPASSLEPGAGVAGAHHEQPPPPISQAIQHQPPPPLTYLQHHHQQLALRKALAHSTSLLANDAYLAGMSSDSELSASSSSSRAHMRPHSSQSRVYHAHPAPRQPPQHQQDVGRPSSGHYGLGPSELTYAGTPSHASDSLKRPQQHPSRPASSAGTSTPARQLPGRPFKQSISVDQQGYQQQQQQQQHPHPHPHHQHQQQQPHHQYYQPHQLTGAGSMGHHYGAGSMEHSTYLPPANAMNQNQDQHWSTAAPAAAAALQQQGARQQPQVMQDPSLCQQENRFRQEMDYLEERANAMSLGGLSQHNSPLAGDSQSQEALQQVGGAQHRHSGLRYPVNLGLSADQLPKSLHLQKANEQQQAPVDWLPPIGRSGVPFKQAMSIDQHQPSQYTTLANRQPTNHYYSPSGPLAGNPRHQDAELELRLEQQQQQQQHKSVYLSQNNHYHHSSHQQLYSTTSETLPTGGYLSQRQSEVQQQQQQQAYNINQQQQSYRMQESSQYGGSNSQLTGGGQVRERSPARGSGLQHQFSTAQHQQQQPPSQYQSGQQLRSAIKRVGYGLGSSTSALNEFGAQSASEQIAGKSLLGSEGAAKRPTQLRAASPAANASLALGGASEPLAGRPGTSAARQVDRQQQQLQQQQHYLAREAGQHALASSESTRSESSTGLPTSNGPHDSNNNSSNLTKKSNSATQLSMSGTKKRLGFRKKQVTSFSVHRSEEVGALPDAARNLVKQGSSVSEGESSLSGDSSSRSWSNSNFKQQTSEEVASMSFIDGLGKGQMISRQGLASPYLGDIQLSLSDRRGNLEVEVIRARNLQAKANKILPLTYVKLYLVKNRKCLAKAKTALCNKRTLDPLFQQQLTFHEDYHGSILQSIVWGNFGKMDKKNFMGIAQISIDDLDLSETVLSWYKLFLPSSLQTMPSKSLRHTLLSNSTESFTTNTNTNTNS